MVSLRSMQRLCHQPCEKRGSGRLKLYMASALLVGTLMLPGKLGASEEVTCPGHSVKAVVASYINLPKRTSKEADETLEALFCHSRRNRMHLEESMLSTLNAMKDMASDKGKLTYLAILRYLQPRKDKSAGLPNINGLVMRLMMLAQQKEGTDVASEAIRTAGHFMLRYPTLSLALMGMDRKDTKAAYKSYVELALARALLQHGAPRDAREGLGTLVRHLSKSFGDIAAGEIHDHAYRRDLSVKAGMAPRAIGVGKGLRLIVDGMIPPRERMTRKLYVAAEFTTDPDRHISLQAIKDIRAMAGKVQPGLRLSDCDEWSFPGSLYRCVNLHQGTEVASEAIEAIAAVGMELRRQPRARRCAGGLGEICRFPGMSAKDIRLYKAEMLLYAGAPKDRGKALSEIAGAFDDNGASMLPRTDPRWSLRSMQRRKYAASVIYTLKVLQSDPQGKERYGKIRIGGDIARKAEAILSASERKALRRFVLSPLERSKRAFDVWDIFQNIKKATGRGP